jgi:hypothetical protein
MSLTAEAFEKDPKLWERVGNGEFRLVYATPETLLDSRGTFMTSIVPVPCAFVKNLVLVAVDECHLVWDWKGFRKQYSELGPLRSILLNTRFMGLSATLAPNVAAYFHDCCRLRTPAVMVDVGNRRDNINIQITAITAPGITQLLELIPMEALGARDRTLIPKTIIFHDNIDAGIHIANALIARMRTGFDAETSQILVANYYGSIDADGKDLTVKRITSGETRFVVCTDAFGLGINIRDIDRVVQWEVDEKLVGSSLTQRIGRGGRDPSRTAVAIVFIQKAIQDTFAKHGIHTEGAWKEKWAASSSSSDETSQPPDPDAEPEDLRVAPLAMDPDSKEFSLYMKSFTIPVSLPTKDKVDSHLLGLFRDSKNLKEALEHAKEAAQGTRQAPMPMAKKIDPQVLWFLATQGCRHMALGAIFKDINLYERSHRSWCCDWCFYNSPDHVPGTHAETAGISTELSILNPNPPVRPPVKRKGNELPLVRRTAKEVSARHATVIYSRLHAFRERYWQVLSIPNTEPCIVIPDKVLKDITSRKNLRRITDLSDLVLMLKVMGIPPELDMLGMEDKVAMFEIIDLTLKQTFAPVPILPNLAPAALQALPLVERIVTTASDQDTESRPVVVRLSSNKENRAKRRRPRARKATAKETAGATGTKDSEALQARSDNLPASDGGQKNPLGRRRISPFDRLRQSQAAEEQEGTGTNESEALQARSDNLPASDGGRKNPRTRKISPFDRLQAIRERRSSLARRLPDRVTKW